MNDRPDPGPTLPPRRPLPPEMHRIHRLWRAALVGLVWAAGMLLFARVTRWFGTPVAMLREPSVAATMASATSGESMPGDAIPGVSTSGVSTDAAAAPLAAPIATSLLPSTPPSIRLPTPSSDLASTPPSSTTSASTSAPASARVGLLVGHWQHDSGTVCDDGLREVDVTMDVALRTQAILAGRGFDVDLLPEHDPKVPAPPVQGYQAAALVAIHADSCQSALTGFKVARWRYSGMPETDDRLVDCLQARYAAATLLPRNDDTISVDMWNYYAFREIGIATPAAIIELAFLLGDRAFVDAHRYEMAQGVADGITCFLRGG